VSKQYNEELKDILTTPCVKENCKHVFHQYALLAKSEDERTQIMNKLKAEEVACGIYYPIPLHLQECFKYLGYKEGDLPVTENICKKIFSLPIYPEVDYKKVLKIFRGKK